MNVLKFWKESTGMREDNDEIHVLSQYLIDEIILAFGLQVSTGNRRVFNLLLQRVTHRLAGICVQTDRRIATEGFPAAVGWMAGHWVQEVHTRGGGNVPHAGPLLVVSNHVGAYDILVVPSQINRPDIKIIASASPFFTPASPQRRSRRASASSRSPRSCASRASSSSKRRASRSTSSSNGSCGAST